MSNINTFKPIGTFIDEDRIEGSEWKFEDGNLLIPVNKIKPGDSLNILYPDNNAAGTNATLLSLNHKKLYKDIELTTEVEFIDSDDNDPQTLEIISRAINKYDKRFSTDEYYALGYRDGTFYFTKYSYFLEGENSFVYSVLYNLDISDDQLRYFIDFTDEQKKDLFIEDKLRYNTKYLFKFSIVGDSISLFIKRRSGVPSQDPNIPWVTIFDNVSLLQNEKSVRNTDLNKVVSVPVEPNNIDNKGMFGINVPNSHVRLYRVEMKSLDDDSDINLYDDIEYSRNIATEYNFIFKNDERILLNSVTGPEDNEENVIELHNTDKVLLDKRNINISVDDIQKVNFNKYELNEDQYQRKFIYVTNPLSESFTGSSIYSYINENNSFYGQHETYLTPSSIDNTNTFEFNTREHSILKNAEGVISSDVLVEVPSNLILDNSPTFKENEVGIVAEDKTNFITKEEIVNKYAGRRFFLETTFRGERKTFELGYLEQGKLTFNIDSEFLKIAPTYQATWDFHLSHWIDKLATDVYTSEPLTNNNDFGYNLLKFDVNLIKEIDSTLNSNEVYDTTHTSYPTISEYFDNITAYAKENDVFETDIENISYALIYFNQFSTSLKDLVLDLITPSTVFNATFLSLESTYFTSDADYHTRFRSFRDSWLAQAENFRQLSLENRKYYISLLEDEYTLDVVTNKLDILTTTQYNDKVVKYRVWENNNITLTNSFDSNVQHYDIPSNIQNLYTDTDGEYQPISLYGKLDSDKIKVINNGGITYAVVPNLYLGSTNDRTLYADIEVDSPYPEASEKVKRKVKSKLVKVQDLLDFEYTDRRTGEAFDGLGSYTVGYNRPLDNIDTALEQEAFSGVNRYYPNPTDEIEGSITTYTAPTVSGGIAVTTIELLEQYLDENNIKLSTEQWILSEIEKVGFWTALTSPLLYQYTLTEDFVSQILDVGNWFNTNDTKLGSFYRRVLDNIIETKNTNKIIGERAYKDDYFQLENWLDGFYTGTRSELVTLTSETTPWGSEHSRTQLFSQLTNTLKDSSFSEKFPNHTLFFVDLSDLITDQNLGFGTNFIDNVNYPIGTNDEFINNPFVNTLALSGYSISGGSYNIDSLVVIENDDIVSDETDFSFIEPSIDFNNSGKDAYTNIGNSTYTINNIMFDIVNNEDIFWGFDNSILLKDLSKGVSVNVEFEYKKEGFPTPIFSKVNLGTSDGSGLDYFPYPTLKYISGATDIKINRVWLDNYEVTEYNILNIDDNTFELTFNGTVFNNKPNISIKYRTDKSTDTNYFNTFVDNFSNKRQIKWTSLTRDKFGYSRVSNNYVGFVKDTKDGKNIFRKGDMDRVNGDYTYTTGGTTTGRVKIKGLSVGRKNEDVVAISNIQRKNNFEFKTILKYDEDIDRNLMRTSFIFRGKLNLIDDAQYLSDFYEIALNLEDKNVALIQYYYEEKQLKSNILAEVNDRSSLIKKGKEYVFSYSLIKDVVKVYLNERYTKKQFIFEYNLETGPTNDNVFSNVAAIESSLGVTFNKPTNFNDNGNKMGMTCVTDKVYFSDIKIKTFVPNNLTFGDTFVYNNIDKDIFDIKSIYNIKGNVRRIGKTDENVTLVLIGKTLFARYGSQGGWSKFSRDVKDFTIVGKHYYVNELLNNNETVLNVYRNVFQLQDPILTDSDTLVSKVKDNDKVVNKMRQYNGNVIVELTDEHTYDVLPWEFEDKRTWADGNNEWGSFDI